MSKMIQIRNVPEDFHRELKARAALAGQSLSDYLLTLIRQASARATPEEMREILRHRAAPEEPVDAAAIIREARGSLP